MMFYASAMESPRPPERLPDLPPALTTHVGYLSVVMGQRSQGLFEDAMEPLGLRPILFDYLAALADGGPRSQRELARLLEIDAARIVSLTDELESRSLVERAVDASDRRRNLVSLTRQGRSLYARAAKVATKVEGELLSSLSSHDQDRLRQLLRTALGLHTPA
jgi:DNA-binding MarR family transcriptional regulator